MKQVIRVTSVVFGLFLLVVSTAVGQSTFETTANAEFGGDWSDVTMWNETAGSDLDGIPDDDDTVIIQANHEIFIDSAIPTTDGGGTTSNRAKCSSLTIEAGGVLWPNADAVRILEVHGSALTINGALGRGSSEDDLILLVFGSPTIGGSGSIDLQRLLKDGSSNTALIIDTDVNLRRVSGTALYTLGDAGTAFGITVNAGATLNAVSGNVALDGSAGSGLESPAAWTINGTLQVGGTLYAKSDNSSEAVSLAIGNGGIVAAGAVDASSSTAQFALTLNSGGTLRLTSGNFNLTGSSAVFTFDANGTVDYAAGGAQTVNHPDASGLGSILTFSGSGTKTLSGVFNVDAVGTIVLAGTTSISGTLAYDAGATLIYEGTSAQSVGDEWPGSNGPTNVTINNASGVTLNAGRSLGGTLTLTSGSLQTSGYTVDLGSTGTLSGESSQNHVIGNVQAGPFTGVGTQTFGNLGFILADAAVDNDDPEGVITVLRTSGPTGVNAFGSNESISCRWLASYSGSDTFKKNLTLRWFQNDDNGKQVNAMEMWRFDTTENEWYVVSATPQDASGNPRSMSEDITSFSTYTTSDSVNPLPVELTAFDARADADHILLRWATASETNNAGFEVQRRLADAVASHEADEGWEVLGFVEGVGTTLEAQTYTFTVAEREAGRHVFRLKQMDFDGTFEYSPEVEVAIELPEVVSLSPAYPNPFNPQTRFTLSVAREQQVTVEVFDLLGRRMATLFDGVLTAQQAHAFTFDASTLPSGMYIYRAIGETFTSSRTMVLQK